MQTANDLPIRMYGVMPLNVEDKNTILNPVIEMPKELRSEQTVSIKVSEKNNNPMTYTLAVVDEGLLGLTNFKTPNPADEFFAKEALGVRTWDIFNLVIGAQKGKAEHLLSIGGGANIDREQKQKAKRFKPVVKFLGPFTLQKGSKTHTIKIPKYIGAVRTMVVAGNNTAYGSAEKTTPVIKPLMVTATLPRVLRPKEKLKLPVTLFAMKDNIKSAKVTITTDKYIKVIGSPSQTVSFTEDGEQNIAFDIEVLPVTGIAKVKITAVSGKEKSTEEIEIDVENPNPVVNQVYSEVTEHHKKWKQSFELPGIKGTNKAVLEVSSIPAINLDSRLKYLIRYPHGCIEQVTSSVFPQLFLANITKLTSEQKSETEHNIKTSLKKYSKFQLTNGGFSYWQGGRDASLWGTNYAGHFLIEANKRGYPVNPQMISKWRDFQSNEARNWTDRGPSSQLMQAYRLYTLALSGKPERSSMNRLKSKSLSTAAKWRLAAAYYISGKRKTAEKLTHNLSYNIASYRELFYTYGSDLRDQSMILETMTLTNDNNGAFKMLKTIAAELSSDKYFSTQTTAYALVAISAYIDKFAKSKSLKFSYAVNGKTKEVNINKTIAQIELNLEELKTYQLKFENRSKGVLYASVLLEGKPDIGKSVNESHDLSISVNYKLPGGERLSPDRITQGTDFIAEVSITNPGSKSHYHELALSQMFPSGWEIINSRMYDYSYSSSSPMDYQDIRDDRVYTYFDLRRNKSVTYTVMLNASYVGKFWLPPVHCEAMYDPTISASQGGKFVEVIKM
ncbi:MAG: alpha-2-macroglobulin family protein [Bacteroidota bacterium]|nr:alpha-2-macroglobulin family protein [Bacteroidota bacterium]